MKRFTKKTILAFIIVFACSMHKTAQMPAAGLPESKHTFIVIAHRGDHSTAPENTTGAFTEAIKNAVDYVEMDLRTSKDSTLVIMHDATVDRMTNGKGKISELTFAEIRQLKITGKNTSILYNVPTFEEVLTICKNKIHIYLDFKDADVEQAYQMITKNGMQNQVIVYINSVLQYKEWKRTAPAMPLMVSLPEKIKNEEDLHFFLEKTPVALLDGNYSDYTVGMVAAAKSAGIPVWPDIQGADEAGNWDRALELGFKGLQTDHPEQLIAYLKKKGLR
jgi:glycerophosphoryl diester phosphodiesterase